MDIDNNNVHQKHKTLKPPNLYKANELDQMISLNDYKINPKQRTNYKGCQFRTIKQRSVKSSPSKSRHHSIYIASTIKQ